MKKVGAGDGRVVGPVKDLKEKIKTILIGGGAGIVGVAAGIVIGFFAIR